MPCPDLLARIAAAADLSRPPLRHGVRLLEGDPNHDDVSLRLEARNPMGERQEEEDLDLELYRSGDRLNLTLAWHHDDRRPMLWQGGHGVWMDASGRRCAAPADGTQLEALARRLRALVVP
ncbi:MAG: hypothetical protein VKN13_08425 [Cyanobacteriota bacterium]|nr:hypothetical protein [Cyanobacteriota bacterium]